MENNPVFSLDIGTRTIIGLVGEYREDEVFEILAYAKKEHKKRNMYDGQIHDIEGVAVTVKEIVKELEDQLGEELKNVSIAAAGRSLKTKRIKLEKEINSNIEISRRQVEALELEAVQKSELELNESEKEKSLKYYNIGYTINKYFLEEDSMKSLIGHKGESMGVELLATFLPQLVIESLYSVISKAGLEIASITLEPIAAIEVAIKRDLRLLNLALVDIGAGTSDIALTKDGEIIAYGMTQTAGDEITERLSKQYLLDFKSSEKLKIGLNGAKEHEFTDIVGVSYKLSTSQIVDSIIDIIEEISKEISQEILDYNGKSPDAVFLIGGTSNMPVLREKIAENLGLSKERVSVRDPSSIENIEGFKGVEGPDMITPIGIAIDAIDNKYKNFLKIFFKDEEVQIFNTDNIRVSDVLILTGYNPRNLIPKASDDFIYFINGKKRRIIGELSLNPEILINGKSANLKTLLSDGDKIDIREYKPIEVKAPNLYSLIDNDQTIVYDNKSYCLVKEIKLNGQRVKSDRNLKENDQIEIEVLKTIGEFLDFYSIESSLSNLLVNGIEVDTEYNLQKDDKLSIIDVKAYKNKNQQGENIENLTKKEILKKELELDGERKIQLLVNDEEINISHKKDKFKFVDIFDHIDFDRSKLRGKLILKLNGEDAEFLRELSDGDIIQIYWE